MGKIFCILGKSSTGKDTVYRELLKPKYKLDLAEYVSYTTRPMRDNEKEGCEYHFVDKIRYEDYKKDGKIIEERCYDTVMGKWYYFTVNDGSFDTSKNILLIGTVDSFLSMRDYFGEDRVVPLYIDIDDRTRLMRAISREDKREKPQYKEMCRRFVADSDDYSEDRIKMIKKDNRFINARLKKCVEEISRCISDNIT